MIQSLSEQRVITEQMVLQEIGSSTVDRASLKTVDPEKILKHVADYYSLTLQSIRAKKHRQRAALPRKIAVLLIHEISGLSLSEIGRRIGGRSHATIHYLIRSLKSEMLKNKALAREVSKIRTRL